nr:hypothetical protein B0A51_00996 [Rachicladosporium sp. CCFEE 5018]
MSRYLSPSSESEEWTTHRHIRSFPVSNFAPQLQARSFGTLLLLLRFLHQHFAAAPPAPPTSSNSKTPQLRTNALFTRPPRPVYKHYPVTANSGPPQYRDAASDTSPLLQYRLAVPEIVVRNTTLCPQPPARPFGTILQSLQLNAPLVISRPQPPTRSFGSPL